MQVKTRDSKLDIGKILKPSRLITRCWIVFFACLNRYFLRYFPVKTKKILIPTQLLLGDCILMLSLIDKALMQYPSSEVVVAAPAYAIAVLNKLDLPVTWIAWQEKNISELQNIKSHGPFMVAYIPFEKWGSVWANAFGAREIVGIVMPEIGFHNHFLTHAVPLPDIVMPISDWLMQLIPGENPSAYSAKKTSFSQSTFLEAKPSQSKKVILHIGARNKNRRWLAKHWSLLAEKIRANGMQVIWTYAANEQVWSEKIAKAPQDWDTEGKLSFDELITLISNVDAVISPDTGVAHICKLTATPSVVIYGQGNPSIHGNGEYWKCSPAKNVFLDNIPCRSMQKIFGRQIQGVARCDLGPSRCANPYCQNEIAPSTVMKALESLLSELPT